MHASRAMTKGEKNFYCTFALPIEVKSFHHSRIWILDSSAREKLLNVYESLVTDLAFFENH